MKLIGAHHQKKKDGSNSNSSRTSPSRLEDSEFVNNSLLATQNGDSSEQGLMIFPPFSFYSNYFNNAKSLLELGQEACGASNCLIGPFKSKDRWFMKCWHQ